MNLLDASAILLTLAAVFAYLNYRFIKLPTAIGIMLIGLFFSILLILLGDFIPVVSSAVDHFVEGIDFDTTLMDGMLSFLLFAGALHVNLNDLRDQKRLVAILASLGVVLSTFMVGGAFYYLFPLFGKEVPFIWCLVFGSIVSPTDPVAVLGILKKAKVPKSLETKITGESLFNDGVGVVVYLALVGLAVASGGDHGDAHGSHGDSGAMGIAKLFLWEAGGGILWGGVLGLAGYFLLRSIDNYQVEVLITLALVAGGYRAAGGMHISGPLAMVVAGLMIGNHGRLLAMSDTTRVHLDKFWELIDEILNAVLFLLIGLELFVLKLSGPAVTAGLVAIVIGLSARFLAVWLPVTLLKRKRNFSPGVIRVLTWGGIRGGISVALALGLPKDSDFRELFLVMTYVVVIFSIAVQGLTLGPLVRKLILSDPTIKPEESH
ncbi:cation:proton antiporter [Roseibacillus persicicus]|uniref:Na(+)/H(+) antiporter NhaP n=1 Tax=Roseibacillus persicicus TaxID=454148 RepID=A0A918WQ37_9BACT|nr:sodium:proton antiporter [Roseibacillus persicicus]MDQ8189301.1 sodium:proton antiporter [Roseibacillus persicicus]GHC65473.1 Na(+)/H(+) antiporter NhaP [Roseibacillus persicicus]